MPLPLSSYKTPGVYVQEIRKLPPSIAQVATAIPVFIGYTQKAEKETEKDLMNVPTRIRSLAEYVTFFGTTEAEDLEIAMNTISTTGKRIIKVAFNSDPIYRMYYALQMFYKNGGGECFIISVGDLTDKIDGNKMAAVLPLLKEYTDPTLILFPDAVDGLDDGAYRTLMQAALAFCEEPKVNNSFVIMDVKQVGGEKSDINKDAETFRNIAGTLDQLKYGAAYYPYLETSLPYELDLSKITMTSDKVDGETASEAEARIKIILDAMAQGDPNKEKVQKEYDAAKAKKEAEEKTEAEKKKIDDAIKKLENLELTQETVEDIKRVLKNAVNTAKSGEKAKEAAKKAIPTAFAAIANAVDGVDTDDANNQPKPVAKVTTEINNAVEAAVASNNVDLPTQITKAQSELDNTKKAAIGVIKTSAQKGAFKHATLEQIAEVDNGLLNAILSALEVKGRAILPASSAMAGAFARVDNTQGVHKSPANIGLGAVIKPHRIVSDEVQDGLNVDTTAGKSINVIRSFKGRGTLVWGARTLAGNDREWRYISVRRFFNMVEESVKRALFQFIFEPNNPNTWASIRSSISSFLRTQWRAGALLGDTADDSFFVNVGVPETFSEEEMLDGYLVVEIGMAVVRPAEFIILKFSHKFDLA